MVFGLGSGRPAKTGTGDDVVKDTTTAAFAKDVLEASRKALVLVDFWADWCGPCKQLTPVIEKVVRTYGGKVRLVKMNVDQHPTIPQQLRVQSLPTVYAFRDGRPVDGFMGVQPESQIKALIDRLLGGDEPAPDLAEAVKAGDEALAANDLQTAVEIYATVLQEDAHHVDALAGLARCYLKSGDFDRAKQTLDLAGLDKQGASQIASVRAMIELAEKAQNVGDTHSIERRLAADPADHQARFDLAMALSAEGDKAGAVDHLLELFKRSRTWNEDAARKQLVQLFEAWGPKDPATIDGRRRLSSLMFS
jgi:putative thioredoxin